MTRHAPLRLRTLATAWLVSVLGAWPALASITGVCPDGSIFIVQRPDAIPCRDSKSVDPNDLPPLKPEYLPRPYGWEVFNRKNDPNNPYNLVQPSTPTHVRATDNARVERRQSPAPRQDVHRVEARAEFRNEPEPVALTGPFGLADSEIRDLARIVDLSQRRVPASILSRGSGGRLQLARSRAFESRLHAQLGSPGAAIGSVVLFAADTQASGSFYANLTFVQDHVAFQPGSDSRLELGLLHGELGALRVDELVLGYVVLPDNFNLRRPIDIYWNDQQVTTTLVP